MKEFILNPSDVDFSNFNVTVALPDVVHFSQPNPTPDFSAIKPGRVHALALPEYRGKSISCVASHVFEAYSKDFYIPGLVFRNWVVEHYDSAPRPARQAFAPLTDGNWHHSFASVVRSSDGFWSVPFIRRSGPDWERIALWLDGVWNSINRVLLLEI